jgi:hypothetical protein
MRGLLGARQHGGEQEMHYELHRRANSTPSRIEGYASRRPCTWVQFNHVGQVFASSIATESLHM